VKPSRRLPLIRVALASALVGHWVANAIADPGEYASVGLRYEGAALRPILFQTAFVALAIVAITLARRVRVPCRPASFDRTSAITLTAMLTAFQIVAFATMEVTERLSIGERYSAAFRGGILDRGFVIELVVAIAIALLLVAIAIGVRRIVRAVFSAPRTRPVAIGPQHARETTFVRPVLILAGSGGVRAPPLGAP
jgi:hypothetical protein